MRFGMVMDEAGGSEPDVERRRGEEGGPLRLFRRGQRQAIAPTEEPALH
jgi:hypothetical protein